MHQLTVTLEWDEGLGSRWLTRDNLAQILEDDRIKIVKEDWQGRVKLELMELESKIESLDAFMIGTDFDDLIFKESEYLQRQYNLMAEYARVLRERIKSWG